MPLGKTGHVSSKTERWATYLLKAAQDQIGPFLLIETNFLGVRCLFHIVWAHSEF